MPKYGPKPDIEKVSNYEVYQLDRDKKRIKQICGVQRNNAPEGYVCLKPAGHGTNHPGTGPCKAHDRQLMNPNNTSLWHKMNRSQNLPSTLMEFMENATEIEETQLAMVDEDIRMLYALQSYFLESKSKPDKDGKEKELSYDDIELSLKIINSIISAKEKRVKLKKEVVLDASTVKVFVDQVFKIIVGNTNQAHSRRILTEILDNVIMPFKHSGRIAGQIDLTNATKNIAEEVGVKSKKEDDSDFWENLEDIKEDYNG